MRAVVEGRGAAARIPVLLHFWTHVETFEDPASAERVRRVLAAYPEDAQVTSFRMPQMYRGGDDLPEYSWVPFEAPASEGPRGLDAQAALPEWDRFDDVLAQFPDPHQPGVLADAPASDGRYRLAHWWYWLFERHWSLRGMENALMDVAAEPGFLEAALDRIEAIQTAHLERFLREAGDLVDLVFISDDLGTQDSQLISVPAFETHLKPRIRRWCDVIHRHGKLALFHTDGSSRAFLSHLVECGVDVLNPIQHICPGMGLPALARDFGRELLFHGGIENQHVLPGGSPDDVRREVRDCLETLGADGGYIVCSCHNIQAGTPVENVLAMIEAVHEWGGRMRPAGPPASGK